MISPVSPNAHKIFDALEEVYADYWAKMSIAYREQGVYDDIANLIGDIGEGIHLDVGTGLGYLLASIRARCQRATLIGIERNPIMVHRAVLDAVSSSVIGQCQPRQFVDGMIERRFTTEEDLLPALSHANGQTYFVMEDVREPSISHRFLEGHSVHSVSFCFPGRDEGILYENTVFSDFSQLISDSGLRSRRFGEVALKVRKATYALASELTVSDGVLVLADRFQFPSEPDESLFSEHFSSGFPDLETYWSLEDIQFVIDRSYKSGEGIGITPVMDFSKRAIAPEVTYDVPIYRVLSRLRRNERPYESV